ncbi:MAG: hypothetical protein II304_02610 [Bacteroidales bacterium]|nr:hypothetical protein [Bacteroidales bacterium]
MKAYYDLIRQVAILTDEEQENWNNYVKFVQKIKDEKEGFKEKILENINQLSFLKREIEKRLNQEIEELNRLEKVKVF